MPAAALIAGRALTSVVVALAITTVLLTLGWAAYGATIPARTVTALLVTVIAGWGLAGLAVAVRRFSWTPRGS